MRASRRSFSAFKTSSVVRAPRIASSLTPLRATSVALICSSAANLAALETFNDEKAFVTFCSIEIFDEYSLAKACSFKAIFFRDDEYSLPPEKIGPLAETLRLPLVSPSSSSDRELPNEIVKPVDKSAILELISDTLIKFFNSSIDGCSVSAMAIALSKEFGTSGTNFGYSGEFGFSPIEDM